MINNSITDTVFGWNANGKEITVVPFRMGKEA